MSSFESKILSGTRNLARARLPPGRVFEKNPRMRYVKAIRMPISESVLIFTTLGRFLSLFWVFVIRFQRKSDIQHVSAFVWDFGLLPKLDSKNSKSDKTFFYGRKISRWVRVWYQNQRSTLHLWADRKRLVKNLLWLGPDSEGFPIWSKIQTHHKSLILHVGILVLSSHSGGGMSRNGEEKVVWLFLRIWERRVWPFWSQSTYANSDLLNVLQIADTDLWNIEAN